MLGRSPTTTPDPAIEQGRVRRFRPPDVTIADDNCHNADTQLDPGGETVLDRSWRICLAAGLDNPFVGRIPDIRIPDSAVFVQIADITALGHPTDIRDEHPANSDVPIIRNDA